MASVIKFAAFFAVALLFWPPNSRAELKLGAFNIQVFGVSKMENQDVVDILIQV